MTELSAGDLADLVHQRWFAAKDRRATGGRVLDAATLSRNDPPLRLEVVEIEFQSGPSESYLLVRAPESRDTSTEARVGRLAIERLRQGKDLPTEQGGWLRLTTTEDFRDVADEALAQPPSPISGEQSNTSLRFDDVLMLKFIRRLQPGTNPELEISRFLAERTEFANTPRFLGAIEYQADDGPLSAVAVVQAFVANRGDAWRTILERLAEALGGADEDLALQPVTRLGEVTADLHLALASAPDDPDFAPEAIDAADVARWSAALDEEVGQVVAVLDERHIDVDRAVLHQRAAGLQHLLGSRKIRHHGDFHLGQVLETTDGDFVIIDFEGEPTRPLAARRERRSPLRDVAGMLRSFDYARHAALRAGDAADPRRATRAEEWYRAARTAYLAAYFGRIDSVDQALLPRGAVARAGALDALELEKAAYEVLYEVRHRPDWLPIPLAAFTRATAGVL